MKNRLHEKNKGFTLIEIIIVLGIIAVLTTLTFSLIGYLNFQNTKKATKTIHITLDKVRMETISKGISYKTYLYLVENDLYMKIQKNDEEISLTKDSGEKLSSNCKVTYKREGDLDYKELDEISYICLYFSKGSGSFLSDYEWISISNGRKSSTIQFVKETGKHMIR